MLPFLLLHHHVHTASNHNARRELACVMPTHNGTYCQKRPEGVMPTSFMGRGGVATPGAAWGTQRW